MPLKRLLISAAAVLGLSALGLSADAAAPTASGAGHDQIAGNGKSTFTLIFRGGGFRGGGFRGGGFAGGGFRGGGFRGGGFRGAGIGLGLGLGLGYPYGYYGGYYPYYDDAGVCYVVRQRVMTRYGWRIRRVSICE